MPSFAHDIIHQVYRRTNGCCHICRKRVRRRHYGQVGTAGAWSIDHSVPQAHGGTHRRNNLFAACWSCNSAKGTRSTRSARAVHGYRCAPLSRAAQHRAREEDAVLGGGLGLFIGAACGGPVSAVLLLVAGAVIGHGQDPQPH